MTLAAELRLHGVSVVVLERDAAPPAQVRALGLHARSIEILDQRGLLERFLAEGIKYPLSGFFAGIAKPAPEALDSEHAYVLGIPQPVTDRLLGERAAELGADIQRGSAVVAVNQATDRVTATLATGRMLHGRYLVGCDGGRSGVRAWCGIDFPGEPATREFLLGEMEATEDPTVMAEIVTTIRVREKNFAVAPLPDGGVRVVVPAAGLSPRRTEPTLDQVRERLRAVAGTDFGVHSPRWLSKFGDATRLAERYRCDRVFLAGDSAHVHPPLGGQGLNLGIQDAVNLGWKLAGAINGWAPDGLLDTYEDERHPVARDVLRLTRAQAELMRTEPGPSAVREVLTDLMDFDVVNRHLVEQLTALGIAYRDRRSNFSEDRVDLVGRRLPDMPLSDGRRLYSLLHDGRGLLIDPDGTLPIAGWGDRVDRVAVKPAEAAQATAARALAGRAVLLRPDGYVAWVAEGGSRTCDEERGSRTCDMNTAHAESGSLNDAVARSDRQLPGPQGRVDPSGARGLFDALLRWFGEPQQRPVAATAEREE